MLTIALVMLAATGAPPAEASAIFTAAGFTRRGTAWKSGNCDGAESDSYSPGTIEDYRDINGDGRPEAILTEGGAICYGMTGTHFWLLSKQPSGAWARIHDETAMPNFLPSKGVSGWPDIELGGPGFCFPVWRWNGKQYRLHRHEYDGKPCRP